MTSNTRLRTAFSQLDTSKKDKDYLIPAILGFMIQGQKTVEVANRPGYVYARMRNNLNEMVNAYNDKVSPVYDLPVLLQRDPTNPTRYRVEARDVSRYEEWGNVSPYIPKHGNQHSFNPEGGGGGDITWVYSQQIVPWLVSPSGTNGSANVIIHGHTHYIDGQWVYWGGTGTSSILAYKPTNAQAKIILVSLDTHGNPLLSEGGLFSAIYTGTNSILPYVPLSTGTPLAAIRLVSGTSAITWSNIYDVRPFFSGGGAAGSFAGHLIQDDGANLNARSKLNFVGSSFLVYDDPANDATNVSGTLSNADTVDSLHAAELAGSYIRVWDYSAGVVKVFPPTTVGLCGAFTGLGASDEIHLPICNIAVGSGLYLPASVYLIGEDSSQSTLTNTTIVIGGNSSSVSNLGIYTVLSQTGTVMAIDAANCFVNLANCDLFARNTNSSGTALAIGNSANSILFNTKIGAQSPGGTYITPYSSRPYGSFSVALNAPPLYRTVSSEARFGTDANYTEFTANGLFSSGTSRVHIRYSNYNSSNPPSIADLNAAFGSAAVVGAGFTGLLNDNGGGTNEYLCTSDGANWFYVTLTAAA